MLPGKENKWNQPICQRKQSCDFENCWCWHRRENPGECQTGSGKEPKYQRRLKPAPNKNQKYCKPLQPIVWDSWGRLAAKAGTVRIHLLPALLPAQMKPTIQFFIMLAQQEQNTTKPNCQRLQTRPLSTCWVNQFTTLSSCKRIKVLDICNRQLTPGSTAAEGGCRETQQEQVI